MRLFIVLSLLAHATVLSAQRAGTVSPGMSRAKVVAALGAPTTERTVSEFRYLFYQNSCGRACGMNDLVILRNDSVVDAIFRSPNRHYTGTSSSPAPISPEVARKQAPTSGSKPVQMKPAPANDTRPSIPVNPPAVKPAPTKPGTKSL